MKQILLIILTFVFMTISSCSDISENLPELKSHDNIKSREPLQLVNNQTRSIDSTADLNEVYVSGYTSMENGTNMKLLFSQNLANLTGLKANTIYITRYETYYKKFDLNGASFFEDETYDQCGLIKKHTIDGSYLSYTERGYNYKTVGATQIELETHLVHVISDMSGNKLDVYYPCTPNQIKWHYTLFN